MFKADDDAPNSDSPDCLDGIRHVTAIERTRAFIKLQKFLFSVLERNNGEEVATKRATELASKFELHVFNNTETKEEYSKVILSRMQQVNDKRGTISKENSDSKRYLSLSPEEEKKVIQLVNSQESDNILKDIDAMLKLAPSSDGILEERLLKFRNLLKKQREICSDGLFILSLKMVNALFEQSRLIRAGLKEEVLRAPLTKGDILLLEDCTKEVSLQSKPIIKGIRAGFGDVQKIPLEIEALKKIYSDFDCLLISLNNSLRLRCTLMGRRYVIDYKDEMLWIDGFGDIGIKEFSFILKDKLTSLATITNIAWNLFINQKC